MTSTTHQPLDPRVGLDAAEAEQIEASLRAQADRLRAETADATADMNQTLERHGDASDQSDSQTHQNQSLALATSTAHVLWQTEDALHRLQEGSYGLCESCQQPIPVRRLRVLPRATTCVACQ